MLKAFKLWMPWLQDSISNTFLSQKLALRVESENTAQSMFFQRASTLNDERYRGHVSTLNPEIM